MEGISAWVMLLRLALTCFIINYIINNELLANSNTADVVR